MLFRSKNLLKQLPKPAAKRSKGANEEAESRGSMDTHARAAAKESETKALKSALGIEPGYVAGSAFDRELQQKKRDERQEQREAEANKVVELEALLAKERRREAKQQEKDDERARSGNLSSSGK